MMRSIARGLFAAAGLLSAALPAQTPCLETSYGANLSLGNDQVLTSMPLGFSFPGPAGPVSNLSIASNGFVWLATHTDAGCCDGDELAFLNQPPRIAALWTGLDTAHGGVWFRSIAANGSAPARAVITWDAPEQFGNGVHLLAQLQLVADGTFTVIHGGNNALYFHGSLVGVSPGNGAAPDLVDFDAMPSTGASSGSNPAIYDVMPFVFERQTYDLASRSYEFMPNGSGGYTCRARSGCRSASCVTFGRGCPQPPIFYEEFVPGTFDLANQSILFAPNGFGGFIALPGTNPLWTGYSNNLGLSTDQLASGLQLPFTWPHPAGTTSRIDVDSNGCVYPQSGLFQQSRSRDGDPAVFLREPASLAVLWQHMQLDPITGAVLYDVDAQNQIAYVTWLNMQEFGGSSPFTLQLALFATGAFELHYGAVSNTLHTALVGYTSGQGVRDPGNRDISQVPWLLGGSGEALLLSSVANARPVLGATFPLQVDHLSPPVGAGLLLLGARRAGTDLGPLGATDCTAYVDLTHPGSLMALPFAVPGTTAGLSLSIPNDVRLVGLGLTAQAAALLPAANQLGVGTSNGAALVLGR